METELTENNAPAPRPPAEFSPALVEAQTAGVDLDHLRYNLSLTPAQRLARLQAGIRAWHTLRTARRLPFRPALPENSHEPASRR